MSIGSLFSGIGGLDLACEAVFSDRVAWQCEKDEHCRKVLARHWPGVPIFEDVRNVGDQAERVDVLCGGFPCQNVSVAGKQEGIDGEKSGLWSEYVRIVRLLRPRYVIVENVPGLTPWLGRVLGPLAALRYDAAWGVFGACCVGAAHRRERLFIVASDTDRELLRSEQVKGEKCQGAHVARDDGIERQVARRMQGSGAAVSGVCRVAHGLLGRMDRLKALGNAVVPAQAEHAIRVLLGNLSECPGSHAR